jgi:hypothetical protein
MDRLNHQVIESNGPSRAPCSRASRRTRIRGRGLRLQGRDVDILVALAKMWLLRTSDLGRLFFEATGTCQKRLRKLYDAGLVRAVVTDLAEENRYAITRFGYAFLERAADGLALPTYRPPPRVEGRSILHLDLLNRYRVALAVGAVRNAARLDVFRPEWELRSENPESKIVPDAVCRLSTKEGRLWELCIEVDTGSEAPGVVTRKLARYAEQLREGPVFEMKRPFILLVTATERRARTLARAAQRDGQGGQIALGPIPYVVEDGGLTTGLAIPSDLSG